MAWLIDWFKSPRQKAAACFQRGRHALDENDVDLAISWFNACIQHDPTGDTGFVGRGFAYLKKADYDSAIADLSEAIRLGPDNPRSMGSFLPANADVWQRIVKKYDLRKIQIEDLVGESHHYADFCFAFGAEKAYPPAFVSTVKLRQAGFCEFMDTEDMFRHWLSYLINEKVIPKSN